MQAADEGDPDCLKEILNVLIENGASLDVKADDGGNTALIIAA